MSSRTLQKKARALQHLTEDEIGKRPAYTCCFRIAEAEARQNEESIELWAARVFETYRDDLVGSAERKAECSR